ncbi:MAG: hypothetical protein RLY16_2451 [Bacteroidota bacterium]|jgi:hypothetical protein
MPQNFKQSLLQNIKNIRGWKTRRKIVVISVDDYGNVRVDSKQAREKMDKAGLKCLSRFDKFDSLENEDDLQALYETLTSVKDKFGQPAVFTSFAVPVNIDFEKVAASEFSAYHYELLPDTLKKLNGYEKVYALLKEGIKHKLLVPQFHGREHLNLKVFSEKLKQKDPELITALKNRSYTSISSSGYPTINYTAAFDFDQFDENFSFDPIIKDGLAAFEKVYGFKSTHFNPPGGREHPHIHKALKDCGVNFIDTPLVKREHQGQGVYKKEIFYNGKKNALGQTYMVRNCVFEPTSDIGIDWSSYCLKQVETAFRWKAPAIISSHRVNFCGQVDEANRQIGLASLKQLLIKITKKWPDVEFMTATELAEQFD